MSQNEWMDLAKKLAKEGDNTASIREKLLEDEVRSNMEAMSRETLEKVEDDKRRGILRRPA